MRERVAARSSDSRIERVIFIGLVVTAFVHVLLRAIHVPIIHDEAVSFFAYATTGAFQPGYAFWDAGNHLLNSAFGHAGFLIFGHSPLALRAGSVLCFLLYALYAWRFGHFIQNRLIRSVLRPALLLTPFVLDFFSLFRGYGPALAFSMMGWYHAVRYARSDGWPHACLALLGCLLAAFASLSTVLMAATVLALLAVFAFILESTWPRRIAIPLALLLVGGPLLLYLVWYGQELSARGMLYYGSPEGLVDGTLASLCRYVIGNEAVVIRWSMLGLLAAVLFAALWPQRDSGKGSWDALRVLVVCLAFDLIARLALWWSKGVLFPVDRVAVHLVPLFLIIVALALDRFSRQWPAMAYMALVFLFLPLRSLSLINLQRTLLWPEMEMSEELITTIEERQARSPRPLLISCSSGFPLLWRFVHYNRPIPAPIITDKGYPIDQADLLLQSDPNDAVPQGYTLVWKSNTDGVRVFGRDHPMQLVEMHDTTFVIPGSNGPFHNLWVSPEGEASRPQILLDVALRLRTKGHKPALHLVSDAHDGSGAAFLYDGIELHHVHDEWNGDTLRIARHFPSLQTEDWAALYLWMVNGRWVEGECRVRTYRILD